MNKHLETLGLAVTYADLGVAWTAIHRAYESGATLNQVVAAIDGDSRLADKPDSIRALALDLARVLASLFRRTPAA